MNKDKIDKLSQERIYNEMYENQYDDYINEIYDEYEKLVNCELKDILRSY